MTNDEIVNKVIEGIRKTPKEQRIKKTREAKNMIYGSKVLTKGDKQVIWEEIGSRL